MPGIMSSIDGVGINYPCDSEVSPRDLFAKKFLQPECIQPRARGVSSLRPHPPFLVCPVSERRLLTGLHGTLTLRFGVRRCAVQNRKRADSRRNMQIRR